MQLGDRSATSPAFARAMRPDGQAPGRVAVLRALQLGDMLCAVPALRALRTALPESEITLVGLPWARALVDRFSAYVDSFLEFPGFPGMPEIPAQIARVPAFLTTAQACRFDLAIQMHGSGQISNPVLMLLGARLNAGFFLPGQYCPDPGRFLAFPEEEHEIWRLLRLLEFLGIANQGDELEFPLVDADREELAQQPEAAALAPGGYACIHPGARALYRRWPAERFAAVADTLSATGLRIVLTGSAEEQPITRAVAGTMHAPAINMAGRTSLGALGALLAGAALLVSNDTGLSHLAAALRTPSVILAPESQVMRWAPLDWSRHHVIAATHVAEIRPEAVLARTELALAGLRVQP